MITLADIIETKLNDSPYLADALGEGLLNSSALARRLKPEIAREHYKDVSEAAIVMALRRHVGKRAAPKKQLHPVRSISVRSNLVEYVFSNGPELRTLHRRLLDLHDREKEEDAFLNFTQGIFETTVIVSDTLAREVRKIVETLGLRQVTAYERLSAVTLRLSSDTAHTAGVYYPYFKALAWANIHFIEVISVNAELTFIVEDRHVDEAFRMVKEMHQAGARR